MPGMLVVTHGRLAEELVTSARTTVGDTIEALAAVSIDWNDDADEATERIRDAIRRVDPGDGVLLLTDMFGGTPTNLCVAMLDPGRLEIVTGVNLPMLIKFAARREHQDLPTLAREIAMQGRETIRVASELLDRTDAGVDG